MTQSETVPTELAGVALTRTVIVDSAYQRGAARTFLIYALTRPLRLLFLFALFVFWAWSLSRTIVGSPVQVVTFVAAGVFVMGLILAAGVWLVYRRHRKAISAQVPLGATIACGLNQTTLAISSPERASLTNVSAIEKVVPRGEFIFFKTRGNPQFMILGRELLSASDVERLVQASGASVPEQ